MSKIAIEDLFTRPDPPQPTRPTTQAKPSPYASSTPATSPAPLLGNLEPEYHAAYRAWKTSNTPQSRGELLRAVSPVLQTAMYSYGNGEHPALKARAKLLALEAFGTYDPSKGALKTHLLSQLQRLRRISAQQQQAIRVPERIVSERAHLSEIEKQLQDELGREPDLLELADRTGLSAKRIEYIRKAHKPIIAGSLTDETGETYSPASSIPGAPSPQDAWIELVYHDLGPVDRRILDHTLGLHGAKQLPAGEIARRLGVSPAAVSQRRAKIQALLDEQFSTRIFGGV